MPNLSKDGHLLVQLTQSSKNILAAPRQFSLYTIVVIKDGVGDFKADFGTFNVKGPCILFSTPLQTIHLKGQFHEISMLQFHGDYYCIEYHKKEVSCNGILFNNVYSNPCIPLTRESLADFSGILESLDNELSVSKPFDSIVVTLIQLLLAKATSIRMKRRTQNLKRDEKMELFRELLDKYFITIRKPADYAKLLGVSPNSLTKRCKVYFRKTPSELISERIVLEAKKRLHLSRQTVKAIAHALKFDDEHYFSRFFKKVTKVSPQTFRKKTGISVVADLSISNND
jgi:AraC-like DNA-binding protein